MPRCLARLLLESVVATEGSGAHADEVSGRQRQNSEWRFSDGVDPRCDRAPDRREREADEANRKADERSRRSARCRYASSAEHELEFKKTNSELGKTNAELRNTNSELRELRQEVREGFRDVDVRLDGLKVETISIRIATQRTVEHMSRADEDLRTRVARLEEHIGLRSP
jgi:hypothetical protein